jgi:hypothetical protein
VSPASKQEARPAEDSAEVLVFRFPMPENIANTPMHHMVRHRLKTAYWALCDTLQAGGILPPPPVAPWARVAVTSHMTLGNPMDDDNAMARHKPLLDWLKTRGYIVDDRRKCLTWDGLPEQRVSRKNAPGIELILRRVE